MNWVAAGVVTLTLAAVATAAVLSIRDDRRVRRTDAIVERMRAEKTLADDEVDEHADRVIYMLHGWRDGVERP